MKSGSKPNGFTITEVMIFLAVSGALLVSAFSVISGTQAKNEFQQAINDVQSQIDSIINNVEVGYYGGPEDIVCNDSGGSLLSFSNGGERGTNEECTYLGKVIQFRSNPTVDTMIVYSVAGATQTGATKKQVDSITDAKPTVILDSEQTISLKNGLTVSKIKNVSSSPQIGAFGVFTTFGSYSSTSPDQLNSRSLQYDFIGLQGTSLLSRPLDVVNKIESLDNGSDFNNFKNNSKNGIAICFNSGSTNQHGVITIGGGSKTAVTTLEINGGSCP